MRTASALLPGFPRTSFPQRTMVSEVTRISSSSSGLWNPMDFPCDIRAGISSWGVSSDQPSTN